MGQLLEAAEVDLEQVVLVVAVMVDLELVVLGVAGAATAQEALGVGVVEAPAAAWVAEAHLAAERAEPQVGLANRKKRYLGMPTSSQL